MNVRSLERSLARLRKVIPRAHPAYGIILGSGLSDVAAAFPAKAAIDYGVFDCSSRSRIKGHPGRLVWAEYAGLELLIFCGRRHWYEGAGWEPVAAPVFLLRELGATTLVITNAAGALSPALNAGDIMVIDDHINAMGANPLIGDAHPVWGSRFPDQSCVYDPGLRRSLDRAGKKADCRLKHGIYLATSGPAYETPAEVRAFRKAGADAVGMSTVPEALLASASGMKVAGLSCITNTAGGSGGSAPCHAEVLTVSRAAIPFLQAILLGFCRDLSKGMRTTS